MKPAHILRSPETGTDYRLYVETPDAAQHPGPWPVVIFLDGDDQFAPAVAAYRELRSEGGVPPLLLLGVGYGASYTQPGNRRGRDYTPVHHSDEPLSGGAQNFLKFLTATLWPMLRQHHAIDEQRRAIAGHSLGALFVLHALFQPQPFFTHHLASAPSIWWADRAMLQQAARLREQQRSLHARLYLSVGERDSSSMTGDLTLLEQQLADQPFDQLTVTAQRFPRKNHFNVLAPAFTAGLRALFRT